MSNTAARRTAKKAVAKPATKKAAAAKPAPAKVKPSPRTVDSGDRVTEAVYAVVRKHPGSIVAAIAETAGLNAKQVSTTLAKLEAAGRVSRTVNGRLTTWSPTKVNKSGNAKLGKGELAEQAMTFLRQHPGIEFTPGEIGRKLGGRSPGAVLNALVKRTATGEVTQTSDKPVKFAVTASKGNGARTRRSAPRKKAA